MDNKFKKEKEDTKVTSAANTNENGTKPLATTSETGKDKTETSGHATDTKKMNSPTAKVEESTQRSNTTEKPSATSAYERKSDSRWDNENNDKDIQPGSNYTGHESRRMDADQPTGRSSSDSSENDFRNRDRSEFRRDDDRSSSYGKESTHNERGRSSYAPQGNDREEQRSNYRMDHSQEQWGRGYERMPSFEQQHRDQPSYGASQSYSDNAWYGGDNNGRNRQRDDDQYYSNYGRSGNITSQPGRNSYEQRGGYSNYDNTGRSRMNQGRNDFRQQTDRYQQEYSNNDKNMRGGDGYGDQGGRFPEDYGSQDSRYNRGLYNRQYEENYDGRGREFQNRYNTDNNRWRDTGSNYDYSREARNYNREDDYRNDFRNSERRRDNDYNDRYSNRNTERSGW